MVAEDLHLDMARVKQVFFEEYTTVAKRRLGLARRRFERGFELGAAFDHPHPASAATSSSLHEDRKAGSSGERARRGEVAGVDAGYHRYAGRYCYSPSRDLVAQGGHHVRRRPHKDDTRRFASTRELRPFREEAVTRMDSIGLRLLRSANDGRNIQIALGRLGRSDRQSFVGRCRMRGAGVGFRIDRDGADSSRAGAANYAKRDFTTVGD